MAKKIEYYSLTEILKTKAQYYMIYGERSNGKSYAVKTYCLKQFLDSGEQFVYVRRYDSDVQKALATAYFADIPIAKLTKNKYNILYITAGNIFLAQEDENGRRHNVTQCGFVRSLTNAQRYSSTAYPNVCNVILEEFIALNGVYLRDETMLLQHLISTIARRRDIKVFMVANTISRLSPYFTDFGVTNILEQAQGTIDVYEQQQDDGNIVTIACEYCADISYKSKMFFGSHSNMTKGGKWLTTDYPKMPSEDVEKYYSVYTFYTVYGSVFFRLRYMVSGANHFLYCDKVEDVPENARVISNTPSIDNLHTVGFIALTVRERLVFDLISNKKVFFPDNLTGTEFNEVYKKLK